MSKTIDEKVVEMRFDNKQFESGVQTSINTLDKLKSSLKLDDAAKGLDKINASAGKMNMAGLGNAVASVTSKFSAMEVIGITALANITNSAVNAGKQLISSLTVDQVFSGWNKYADKTSAVQTIMAATAKQFSDAGEQMEYVNLQLDKLNWYTDETSYNLLDMVSNIGKFTSNNIDLDTSVTAMQGIANWAAISGANANEASRAMYNLSQAISTGSVKLIDWKSIENANMATAEFKEIALETAASLGTLTDAGEGVYKTLKGNDASITSFNANLSDTWFTSEVLLKTLDKYGGFTNKLNEAYVRLGDGSKYTTSEILDLIDAFKENSSVAEDVAKKTKLSVAEVTDILKELGSEEYELGRRAFKAGQEAKTFSEAINSIKDAVSTGWMNTFELIFGDYNQAKKVWTGFANWLYEVFAEAGNFRNLILESALGKSFSGLAKTVSSISKPAKEVKNTISNISSALKDLNEISNDVIKGSFGNGKSRLDALTKAGYNYYEVQNKVNEKMGVGFRYSEETIKSQEKLLGTQKESIKSKTQETKANSEIIYQLSQMSDAELKSAGYTKKQIDAIRDLEKEASKLGIPIKEFVDNIDEIDGRWILLDSFKNVGDGILETLNAIKDAWREIFYGTTDEDVIIEKRAQSIYNAIAALHKLTTFLKVDDKKADQLKRTFKGLFAILDILTTIIGGPLKIAFKLAKEVLDAFDLDILEVTAKIGDAIVRFRDWVDETLNLKTALEFVSTPMKSVIKSIGKFGKSIKEWANGRINFSEIFGNIRETISKVVNSIKDWINGLKEAENKSKYVADSVVQGIERISEALRSFVKSIRDVLKGKETENVAGNFLKGFSNGLVNGVTFIWNTIVEIAKSILSKFREILGIHSPSTETYKDGTNFVLGFQNGIKDSANGVWTYIKEFGKKCLDALKNFDFGKAIGLALSIGTLATFRAFGKAMDRVVKVMETFSGPIQGVTNILNSVSVGIKNVFAGVTGVLSSFQTKIKAEALKNIAIALAILVGSIIALTLITTKYNVWPAIGALAAIAGILAVLSIAINHFGSGGDVDTGKFVLLLLSLGVAMWMLSKAAKNLSKFDSDGITKALVGIGVFGVVIAGLMAATKLAGPNLDKLGATILAISAAMFLLTKVAKSIAKMSWEDLGKAAVGIAFLTAIVAGLVASTKIAGKDLNKLGATILAISVAMLLLTKVAKSIAKMEWDDLKKAAAGILYFGVIIAGLIAATRLVGNGELVGISSAIFAVGGAMIMLSITCRILSGMDWSMFHKAAKGIIFFGAIIVGLIAATKYAGSNLKGVASTIFMASISIALLAGVAIILGMIKIESLAKGIIAVSMLGMVMAALIASTKGASSCKDNLIMMTVIIATLVASLIALTFIDTKQLAVSVAALVSVMASFAILMKSTKSLKSGKDLIGPLLMMLGAVAIIAGILVIMSKLNVNASLENAAAISILLLALAEATKIISTVRSVSTDVIGAMALLGLIVAEIGIIMGILSLLDVSPSIETATSLSILLLALSAATLILSFVGDAAKAAVQGAIGLAGVVAVLGVVAMAIGGLMSLIPKEKISEWQDGLSDFMNFIVILAGGLGEAIGALVGGVLGGISSALPIFGKNLSAFMDEISPFLDGIKNVDEKVIAGSFILTRVILALSVADFVSGILTLGGLGLIGLGLSLSGFAIAIQPFLKRMSNINPEILTGVKTLSQAILALTAAEFLDSISNLFIGGTSLSDLGKEMAKFGPSLKEFSDSVDGINPDNMIAASEAGKNLAEMAKAVPRDGGLWKMFAGKKSLDGFGESLSAFGTALVDYSKVVSAKGAINSEAISSSVTSANLLVGLSDSVPRMGGLISALIGYDDLASFGVNLVIFGKALVKYSETVGSEGAINSEAISDSVESANLLTQLSDSVPRMGGLISALIGYDDLASFGVNLVIFGKAIVEFSKAVSAEGAINYYAIESAVNAISRVAYLQSSLNKMGGVVSWFTGRNDLAKFGKNLVKFAGHIKAYSDELTGLNTSNINSATIAFQKIANLAKSLEGVKFNGFSNFGKSLEQVGKDGIHRFIRAFKDSETSVSKVGDNMITSLIEGAKSKEGSLETEFSSVVLKCLNGLSFKYGSFKKMGEYLGDGLILGIESKKDPAYYAGLALGSKAAKGVKEGADENSPSKLTIQYGKWLGEGLVIGIDKMGRAVDRSGYGMGEIAVKSISSAVSRITDAIDSGIDVQPTIRPVLDLSEVESGANRIGSLLNVDPSVGVMSNVGAINMMMNRNRNASNDDVVSAIEALGRKVGTNPNNTYNINGITYDDGSNVSSAVETLIRATRIERRV